MKRAFLLVACLLGCAPTLPKEYLRARDAAERAYAGGQFADAGRRWQDAASSATTPRDRAEARYRAATSYERGGQLEQARELYLVLAGGKSDRAARATFALAELRLGGGDVAGGHAELEAAVRKYPSSGVANLALRRYFAYLATEGGDRAVLDYIERVLPALGATDLAEQLLYERARRLDAQGSTADARKAYVAVADRFPYPHGAYWDDALFRGAECEVRLHHSEQAIQLLNQMLAAREVSHLSGSYERPRFAEAAYRLAELYRDARRDPRAARTAFRRVFLDYPTSTMRDDALWQEALLSRLEPTADACQPLKLLISELADSRYAPCARKLCPELPRGQRECATYIESQLATPDPLKAD